MGYENCTGLRYLKISTDMATSTGLNNLSNGLNVSVR